MNFSFISRVSRITGFLDCFCHLLFEQNIMFWRREAVFISAERVGGGGAAVIYSDFSDSMRSNDVDGCKEYLALVT
jgi:hypothetical protein